MSTPILGFSPTQSTGLSILIIGRVDLKLGTVNYDYLPLSLSVRNMTGVV